MPLSREKIFHFIRSNIWTILSDALLVALVIAYYVTSQDYFFRHTITTLLIAQFFFINGATKNVNSIRFSAVISSIVFTVYLIIRRDKEPYTFLYISLLLPSTIFLFLHLSKRLKIQRVLLDKKIPPLLPTTPLHTYLIKSSKISNKQFYFPEDHYKCEFKHPKLILKPLEKNALKDVYEAFFDYKSLTLLKNDNQIASLHFSSREQNMTLRFSTGESLSLTYTDTDHFTSLLSGTSPTLAIEEHSTFESISGRIDQSKESPYPKEIFLLLFCFFSTKQFLVSIKYLTERQKY